MRQLYTMPWHWVPLTDCAEQPSRRPNLRSEKTWCGGSWAHRQGIRLCCIGRLARHDLRNEAGATIRSHESHRQRFARAGQVLLFGVQLCDCPTRARFFGACARSRHRGSRIRCSGRSSSPARLGIGWSNVGNFHVFAPSRWAGVSRQSTRARPHSVRGAIRSRGPRAGARSGWSGDRRGRDPDDGGRQTRYVVLCDRSRGQHY